MPFAMLDADVSFCEQRHKVNWKGKSILLKKNTNNGSEHWNQHYSMVVHAVFVKSTFRQSNDPLYQVQLKNVYHLHSNES